MPGRSQLTSPRPSRLEWPRPLPRLASGVAHLACSGPRRLWEAGRPCPGPSVGFGWLEGGSCLGSPHHAASLPQGTVLRIGAPPNLHLCRNQVQLSVCSRICSALRPRSDPQCKPAVLDALSPVARACVLHGDPSARRFSVVQGQWLRHASNWLHREGNPPLLSAPCPSPLPELPGGEENPSLPQKTSKEPRACGMQQAGGGIRLRQR